MTKNINKYDESNEKRLRLLKTRNKHARHLILLNIDNSIMNNSAPTS